MAQKTIIDINGTLVAETGIVHGMIASLTGRDNNKEKNVLQARRMEQFMQEEENGETFLTKATVPVVSGNAFRGILRRLLVEHSFDVLDLSLEEIFQDMPNKDKVCRDVWFMFNNGGLTPKGSKIMGSQLSSYDKIMTLPWLGLLGGVYYGHQFEGHASFGILYPLFKENAYLYKDALALSDKFIANLPSRSIVETLDTARFTRRANTRDNSAEDSVAAQEANEEQETKKGSTDAMIYGAEYIPAGLQFVSLNRCVTHDDGIAKAFKAALGLFLETHRMLGGKNAMGFGRVHPVYGFDFDAQEAIDEYDKLLLAEKDSLIERIRLIPKDLRFTMKEKEQKEEKEEKKTKKGKKAA